jgi:dipeptidase E
LVNLRDYFDKYDKLKKKIRELGAIFISGGNVFVLRQAMKISGLDKILKELRKSNFLYAGYSAAGCVLSPNLKAYKIIDKVDTPYNEQKKLIWDGLGLINFVFIPHWDSNHLESKDTEKEITYCKKITYPIRQLETEKLLFLNKFLKRELLK